MNRERLDAIARERIIVLDGAMGTMVQTYRLTEAEFRGSRFADHPQNLAGMNDVLCLTRPGVIAEIHAAYLAAGADIIETCSLNATAVSLADYGLADAAYEISRAAARIAREAAGRFSTPEKPRFVAGSIGPTNKSGSMPPDFDHPEKRAITWDLLEAAYYDNVRGLLDGGADILLAETCFDTLNAKAAIAAVNRLCAERREDIPLMLSATITGAPARLLSGESIEAFIAATLHADLWALGFNCSFGAEKMLEPLRRLAALPCLVSAYPNAGLPGTSGVYDETPRLMGDHVEAFFTEGLVNIAGGCCGSTPDHIVEIAARAEKYRPRHIPVRARNAVFAGREAFTVDAARTEPLRGGGPAAPEENRTFITLIKEGNFDGAVEMLASAAERGDEVIVIAVDDAFPGDTGSIAGLVNTALVHPCVAAKPFLIECPRWDITEAAIKCVTGKPLAALFTGDFSIEDAAKDGGAELLRRAKDVRAWGAAAAAALPGENGPGGEERQIAAARYVYNLLAGAGFPVEDMVFYPARGAAAEHFSAVYAWIREHCPRAGTLWYSAADGIAR
ncbi:MAG: homocysteine S-methyltransferase family protein [Spirochaetaceae bacterium]|nr:homocysteine S-methyltransferase family protein [Spirochaetaceae bacterium]